MKLHGKWITYKSFGRDFKIRNFDEMNTSKLRNSLTFNYDRRYDVYTLERDLWLLSFEISQNTVLDENVYDSDGEIIEETRRNSKKNLSFCLLDNYFLNVDIIRRRIDPPINLSPEGTNYNKKVVFWDRDNTDKMFKIKNSLGFYII